MIANVGIALARRWIICDGLAGLLFGCPIEKMDMAE
jgi:hypothetical protein